MELMLAIENDTLLSWSWQSVVIAGVGKVMQLSREIGYDLALGWSTTMEMVEGCR